MKHLREITAWCHKSRSSFVISPVMNAYLSLVSLHVAAAMFGLRPLGMLAIAPTYLMEAKSW